MEDSKPTGSEKDVEVRIQSTKLLSVTGFEKCEFEPEIDEHCEGCNKDKIQLYYRRTCWDVDEGEYYCLDCIEKQHKLNLEHYAKLGL